MMNNLDVVLSYYADINNKNPDAAATKLADNVSIVSPLDEKHGKEAVFAALQGFCSVIDRVEIRSSMANEDQALLAYNIFFQEPIGLLTAGGLIDLQDGLITRIELFFDPRKVISKKDEIYKS